MVRPAQLPFIVCGLILIGYMFRPYMWVIFRPLESEPLNCCAC